MLYPKLKRIFWLSQSPIRNLAWVSFCIVICLSLFGGRSVADFKDGFETTSVAWKFLQSDTIKFKKLEHARTSRESHRGESSEKIQIEKFGGTKILYGYPIQPIHLISDFKPSVWVKSNARGIRFSARVVFPNTEDPSGRGKMSTLIEAPVYDQVGKWQRLGIEDGKLDAVELLQNQIVKLTRKYGKVDAKGAYVDLLVLDLCTTESSLTVHVDDLQILGGVPLDLQVNEEALSQASFESGSLRKIERSRNLVQVDGRPFLTLSIQHNGEDFGFLKELGFNTIELKNRPTKADLRNAKSAGVFLICPPPPSIKNYSAELLDCVLAWRIGSDLAARDLELTRRKTGKLKTEDPGSRPVLGNIASNTLEYSRICDILSYQVESIGTSLDLNRVTDFVSNRVAKQGDQKPVYVSVQTQYPESVIDQSAALAGQVAQLPIHHTMLKKLCWRILAGGARGLMFTSRGSLQSNDAETHFRRDSILWLNKQLKILKPWIASSTSCQEVVQSSSKIKTYRLGGQNSHLFLLFDPKPNQQIYLDADYQKRIDITGDFQNKRRAFQISESGFQSTAVDSRNRIATASVENIYGAGAIVVTGDANVVEYLSRAVKPSETEEILGLHVELSGKYLTLVNDVHTQLSKIGRGSVENVQQIRTTLKELYEAKRSIQSKNYKDAKTWIQRADIGINVMTRNQLTSTTQTFSSPTSSPLFITYQSLPLHYALSKRLKAAGWEANILPAGDFEDLNQLVKFGWGQQKSNLSDIATRVSVVGSPKAKGLGAFEISAVSKSSQDNLLSESTPVWVTSPKMQVRSGQVLRIHGWVKIDREITNSSDGFMIFDNLGKAAIAERFYQTKGWKEFTYYRGVDQNSEFQLTMALTGLGTVHLDELTVHVAQPASPTYKRNRTPTQPVSNRKRN